MLVLHRPAKIVSSRLRLDQEYRSARWLHHQLLNFEDAHQKVLDETSELVAPGILRVGRILARLKRRAKRAERSSKGTWAPNPHPKLAERLKERLDALRKQRNNAEQWKTALKWADEQVGEPKQVRRRRAKPAAKIQRRKTESEEAFQKRFQLLTTDESDEHYAEKCAKAPRDTRRDVERKRLYALRHVYWGTWNALLKSVDSARKAVLSRRKQGMPAEWRHPRWDAPNTLSAEAGGFRVLDREGLWWTIEMRVGLEDEWVRFRAKGGNWHPVGDSAKLVACQLTRRREGNRWVYSVSITVDGVSKNEEAFSTTRTVAFDWGHREKGHPRANEGIRAFTWLGDDGKRGEILLPTECRTNLDELDELKSRVDKAFDARKVPEKNRYVYRRRLMQSGVRTEEETLWLAWETKYERRMLRRRKRIQNLRKETYLLAVRSIRKRYKTFVFEDESAAGLRKKAKDEHLEHRKRSNRDMTARFEFVTMCERFGANIVKVSAHNTTRECPDCGQLVENGPELLVACPGCGVVRDKDQGAARVILKRGTEALANQSASV